MLMALFAQAIVIITYLPGQSLDASASTLYSIPYSTRRTVKVSPSSHAVAMDSCYLYIPSSLSKLCGLMRTRTSTMT